MNATGPSVGPSVGSTYATGARAALPSRFAPRPLMARSMHSSALSPDSPSDALPKLRVRLAHGEVHVHR
jgi:hypothetical protein